MSKIKIITINPAIHQILTENKGNYLSIKEIKSKFVLITNIQINSDELTKVIYRQLLRLVTNQIVEKELFENSKSLGYKSTKIFELVEFKFKKLKVESNTKPIESKPKLPTPKSDDRAEELLNSLTNQLTQYEVDFQSSIAETQEYKRLFTIAPEMKNILETHFLEARNKSNQLLGKITAVKNIIEKVELSNQS
jgi:hypothetical protein